MPYVKQEDREVLDPFIFSLNQILRKQSSVGVDPAQIDPGLLNYTITKLLLSTLPANYRDYNALIGVLEAAKLEFYRRAVAAYEDEKIKQNGDVYPRVIYDAELFSIEASTTPLSGMEFHVESQ